MNPLLCIDTETTGVNPAECRIVEVACVDVLPDGTATNAWSTIVDPGVDIPAEAVAVHKISTSRAVAEGVEPKVALEHVAQRIFEHIDTWGMNEAAIVMYNATFDWPLILAEAERHGAIDVPAFAAILDPLLIDRKVDKYRKGSRKLVDVAAHYKVELSAEDAHGAAADAAASGRVMWRIVEAWPHLSDYSLAMLWMRQVRAHEEWRFGLVDYLRRSDPDADIAPGWPLPARAAS